MAEPDLIPRSPLANWAGRFAETSVHSGGRLSIEEQPLLTSLNVRARRHGLPAVNDSSPWAADSGQTHVLGLGPDEWLAVGPPGAAHQLEARLRQELGDALASIVDVSAQRTTLLLSGPAVTDLLAHGCALDLDPTVFGVGRCAQTMLAHAQVILWRTAPREFRVLVRPSFAGYLAEWLCDAATELCRSG